MRRGNGKEESQRGEENMKRREQLIIVRGAGDIATGTIHRLVRCGYPVLALETASPSAIRRRAAFSEAVYDGRTQVEGIACVKAESLGEAFEIMKRGEAAVMTDPECRVLERIRPWALVDAVLAKKNLGTNRGMAAKTIALGPGFTAGEDVDLGIETMRGHNLGRIIQQGCAMANTGVPGIIAGFGKERVIYSPAAGRLHCLADIGDVVTAGQAVAVVEKDGVRTPVYTAISGLVRGMLREGYPVKEGLKMADVDPRESQKDNCFTISDKARCIAGSVLEGLLYLEARDDLPG